METATEEMVWSIIRRLQSEDGDQLSPRAVARIHAIIDDCRVDYFPDTDSQTNQAKWLADRIERNSA
jgi:hypothetical protein